MNKMDKFDFICYIAIFLMGFVMSIPGMRVSWIGWMFPILCVTGMFLTWRIYRSSKKSDE